MGEESCGIGESSHYAEAWRSHHPALWPGLKIKVKQLMKLTLELFVFRWREAVCLMMVLAEPGITAEDISSLGRQMAGLFRQVNGNVTCPLFLILNDHQDNQLWEVKASQLAAWVDRGLLNVKLLDRTLAYFQNQSSFLQYIRALKKPVPKIESPGFPGTQWNEFYWKDQTVMLLMQVIEPIKSLHKS